VLASPEKAVVEAVEKQGDWNQYEIRAEGQRIQLFLNGKSTVDFTESQEDIDPSGLIALQVHGNCKAEISFRNITLEVLPDAPASGAK